MANQRDPGGPGGPGARLREAAERFETHDRRAAYWRNLHNAAKGSVLALGLAAAAAGAVSLTVDHRPLRLLGTVLPLAVVAIIVLLARFSPARRWIAHRGTAEAIKSQAFLFAAGVGEYTGPDAGMLFERRVNELAAGHDRRVEGEQPGESDALPDAEAGEYSALPRGPLDAGQYVDSRLLDQIRWYEAKAKFHRRRRRVLGWMIGAANLIAAGLELFLGEQPWSGVVTGVVGALTAFSTLSASDYLAGSYHTTARELHRLWGEWQRGGNEPAFGTFALEVERVIAREHSGWVAVLSHSTENAT